MKNKRIHQSSGVTIIEVLFSIGIIVTGLLGVAGLIMVAGTQMTQGLEADAMSNAGLNAIAEFETRNMQNPNNLVWFDPDPKINQFRLLTPKFILGKSFCIDPFFIAQQQLDKNFKHLSYFPSTKYPNPTISMLRVTLRDIDTDKWLPLPLSREIFIAKDDLAFSTPASATELPEQQWITEGFAGPKLKRTNHAEYSWLAMLTPAVEKTDHYLISIVVFKNRGVRGDLSNSEEQFFKIDFLNSGFGGGEVELSNIRLDGLYPRHGDWVMLSAATPSDNLHRWYQVTYIDEENHSEDGGTHYHRHATLQGPDWRHSGSVTQVTLIPGVVGVFEKTTRLGATSLYDKTK